MARTRAVQGRKEMAVAYRVTPELRVKLKEPFGTLIRGSFVETMDKLEDIVKKKEQELIQRELKWIKAEDEIKKSKEDLREEKTHLETDVAARKEELGRLEADWQQKKAEMLEMEQSLKESKSSMEKMISQNLTEVGEKEKEIEDIYKKIDADKKRLEKDEKSIIKKVRELEKAEAKFKREYKPVKKLKADNKKKERQLKTMLTKAKKIVGGLEKAKKTKKGYKGLARQAASLDVKFSEMSKPKEEELMPKARIAAEIQEHETEHVSKHLKIHDLLDEARHALNSGDLGKANDILVHLHKKHKKMKNTAEKRSLDYEIRDLEASIKLAMLS